MDEAGAVSVREAVAVAQAAEAVEGTRRIPCTVTPVTVTNRLQ